MKNTVYLKVKDFIREHALVDYGDKIVAGVSGGAFFSWFRHCSFLILRLEPSGLLI